MVRSCNLIYNLHWRSSDKFSPVVLIFFFFLMSSKSLLVAHNQMICAKWKNQRQTLACFIMSAERLNLLHIAEDIWVRPILIHHGENFQRRAGWFHFIVLEPFFNVISAFATMTSGLL